MKDDLRKYGELCDTIMDSTEADGVMIVVFGGKFGNGGAMKLTSKKLLQCLPDFLEDMAKGLRDKGSPE